MAPKKKTTTTTAAKAANTEATKASQEEKEQQQQNETTTTTTATENNNSSGGPSAPPNQAAAVAQQFNINATRLTRFARPFQAGRKGGPQQVAPRPWRVDTFSDAAAAVTEDGAATTSSNSNKAPISITKELVEELTNKLGPIDLQRAAAKQDPIPVISTEAANLRSKRFHTETPQEQASKRESRFTSSSATGNGSSSSSSGLPQAPSVDAELAAKREARWGVTLSQPAKAPVGNGVSVIKKGDNEIVAKVELTEAEKKRLERFQK